jgi:hypothetical protein
LAADVLIKMDDERERIDYSVYPDLDDVPAFVCDADRADYVARICGAWDFGVVPTPATFEEFATWRPVFDRYPIATSPAYVAFRSWYAWEPIEHVFLTQAAFERDDAQRGRASDWTE